jgi:hypothetical protein
MAGAGEAEGSQLWRRGSLTWMELLQWMTLLADLPLRRLIKLVLFMNA